ncbi:MAG: hypothetical protein Q9211_000441 [Gyalolechia sp. 1 TL-2023]
MSSSDCSDGGSSDNGIGPGRRKRMDSTPRTPLSPQRAASNGDSSKPDRSSSFVRFHNLKVPPEHEDSSVYRRTPRSPVIEDNTHDQEQTADVSSQVQSQLLDRIESLEAQLRNLDLSRNPGISEKGNESSEQTGLSTEIHWMTWQEYLNDASRATNVLEVLFEKPHTNNRRKSSVALPSLDLPQRFQPKTPASSYRNIERIRIRSYHIISALQNITEQTFSNSSRLIIHRPFKLLLFYHDQILDYLLELENDFDTSTDCALGKQCKGFVDLDNGACCVQGTGRMRSSSFRRNSLDETSPDMPKTPHQETAMNGCRHELSEELLAQAEAISHLRLFTKFMDEDMKDIFAKHELLRSSKAEKIAFVDMWHLFEAGDLIVAESDSSERSLELYQVAILPACDFFSSRRPVKQIQTKTEGSHKLVESVYGEESVSAMSVFTIDAFFFDFDGQKFGPVERRLELVSFEGERNIVDLSLYPLRFRKDAAQFKNMMLGRDRFMFDDHRVDRQRTVEFIRANGSLLRITSSEELTESMMLLLPNRVYGFVLRSRRWHFLNIDSIRPLERHSDGFEALVLPPGVARLVESLVKTHDPQNMPSFTSNDCENEHHVDLVRGKGKGLIILLHGAPGVGKTSTAECVADYTHRPLFPITCGDIGETSKEVEHNLEQNFSLAHRWGCVLLLDEADVFLQARDRENMRRNGVVSVFLRVLEFYSGILFLTTNKVGHFDEAFKSRIHVSLYYPALDKQSTLKIWKMNLERLSKSKKALHTEADEIYDYAKKHYKGLEKKGKTTWNGRQIKNAFQTAIALAEFDANKTQGKPVLSLEHFKVVARASEDFDDYLSRVHGGNEADVAKRCMQRVDDPPDDSPRSLPYSMIAVKPSKKYEDSTSSSSEESDLKEKRRRKKEKQQKKTRAKSKPATQVFESEGASSSSSA